MKILGKTGFLVALLAICGLADAQVYTKFGPATGILKGSTATYQTTAAVAADVTALYSGCTGLAGQYLAANGTCQSAAGAVSGANPTATIGLTAINGSATTYLRSDGAPALSQSIAPTMTGLWVFTPGSTAAAAITVNAAAGKAGLQVNASANSNGVTILGNATTGQSAGLFIAAGTNSSDGPLTVMNATNTTNYLKVFGDGGTVLGTATGGDQGLGTLNMQGCFINGVACATGGAPGGSNTQLQFNNSGVFGGASNLVYTVGNGNLAINAPSSGVPLQVTGLSNSNATVILGGATSAQSLGLRVDSGTTSADYSALFRDKAGADILKLQGDHAGLYTGGFTVLNNTGSQNFSQMVLNSTTSGVASYMTFNNNGTQKGVILNERTAGSNCAGSAVDDFCVRSISGGVYTVDSMGAGYVPHWTRGTTSMATGAATTVATLANVGVGNYIAMCGIAGSNLAAQSVSGFISANGTSLVLSALGATSGTISVTVSGLGLVCTQTTGSTQSVNWSYTRIGG